MCWHSPDSLIHWPIMLACSQLPQAARHSWSSARDATAMFHQAGKNFRFSPSLLSVPCAANCDGIGHPKSFSVGLTASSPGSNEREAGNASDVECGLFTSYRKNSLGLVVKFRTALYISLPGTMSGSSRSQLPLLSNTLGTRLLSPR